VVTHTGGRPHLGDIARGLFDARVSGVDFWDTDAGRRLLEWHRGGALPTAPEPGAGEPAAAPGRPRPAWSRLRRTRR
jgi:hypothetical protein